MKFNVKRDNLLKVLQKVTGIVPQRTSFEILTTVYIHVLENKIEVSSTDLDMAITSSCDAEVIQKGDVVINARRLHLFVKEVFDDMIEMETQGNEFIIRTSNGNYKMPLADVEKFPQIPEFSKPSVFTIEPSRLIDYIDRTSFLVSKDDMKPSVTGVFFHTDEGKLFITATDGHRLVELKVKQLQLTGNINAIVPPKSLNHLKRITEDESEKIDVFFESNSVGFKMNGDFISTKIISGDFPNYKEVIPRDNNKIVIVDRDEFLAALKRISIFSNPANHEVRFIFSDNLLNFQASAADIGSGEEKLDIEYSGDQLVIGFNANDFGEIVKRMSSDRLLLKLNNELSATLIFPEKDDDEFDIFYVMMPLRLE